MQRRHFLRWGLGWSAWAASGQLWATESGANRFSGPEKLVWRERALVGFGTTLWLKAAHQSADQCEAALTAAIQAIRRVEHQMSLFDADSALCRLNARGYLRNPGPELRAVLELSHYVARKSGGAFDISMQPLWQVWSQAAQEGALPSRREVQRAQKMVNWEAIEITDTAVQLNQSGMSLSLNGIAQGYASDIARAALQSHGIQHALVDAGETSLLGKSDKQQVWKLAIESATDQDTALARRQPLLPVVLADGRAIATSSDAHTVFSTDHQHHHILNPHTGYSPPHWSSVTVMAPSCVLADALTKVFFMLPPSQVMPAARLWGVDIIMQDKAGKWLASPGAQFRLEARHRRI